MHLIIFGDPLRKHRRMKMTDPKSAPKTEHSVSAGASQKPDQKPMPKSKDFEDPEKGEATISGAPVTDQMNPEHTLVDPNLVERQKALNEASAKAANTDAKSDKADAHKK
jgi:hypothetical protein